MHRWRTVGPPADVFALGCLLYQLCFARLPFGVESKMPALCGSFKFPRADRVSEGTRALIEELLSTEPSARPLAATLARTSRTVAGGRSRTEPRRSAPRRETNPRRRRHAVHASDSHPASASASLRFGFGIRGGNRRGGGRTRRRRRRDPREAPPRTRPLERTVRRARDGHSSRTTVTSRTARGGGGGGRGEGEGDGDGDGGGGGAGRRDGGGDDATNDVVVAAPSRVSGWATFDGDGGASFAPATASGSDWAAFGDGTTPARGDARRLPRRSGAASRGGGDASRSAGRSSGGARRGARAEKERLLAHLEHSPKMPTPTLPPPGSPLVASASARSRRGASVDFSSSSPPLSRAAALVDRGFRPRDFRPRDFRPRNPHPSIGGSARTRRDRRRRRADGAARRPRRDRRTRTEPSAVSITFARQRRTRTRTRAMTNAAMRERRSRPRFSLPGKGYQKL